MAFYSTFPSRTWSARHRPRRIRRFLMSLPPHRMYDVWRCRLRRRREQIERLLLAALDYSIHHYVVYVAAKPPRSIFKTIANRVGRTIVYIPIGQLSLFR